VAMVEPGDLGKLPIPGPAPGGVSARYEPEYEQVTTEVAKLDSLHADAAAIDWQRITELGCTILHEKSKDLTVAAYVCLGLLHTRGYAGFAPGLAMVADLLETFWDGLFPELARLRGRINALNWLSERGGSAVAGRRPESTEAAAVAACTEAAKRLQDLVVQRFGDEAPSFGELQRALRERVRVQEEAAHKAEASAKTAAAPAAAGAASGTFGTVREAHDVLLRVASFLRQQVAQDPLAFLLPRAVTWGAVAQLPTASADGKTMIPGVLPQVREPLARMFEAANWSGLLDQAEARFPETPLWLDLQRYVDAALGGLGAPYAGARRVLRSELAALLERHPRLRELRFADNLPLADAATQGWLDGEVLKASAAAAPAAASSTPLAFDDVRRLFAEGKVSEALAAAQQEMNGSSGRDRFIARLELARLCQASGKQRVTVRLLEALDQEAGRFGLDEWEPALAVQLLKLLYQYRRAEASAKNPEATRSIDELFRRLCRLDLLAALALEGS